MTSLNGHIVTVTLVVMAKVKQEHWHKNPLMITATHNNIVFLFK